MPRGVSKKVKIRAEEAAHKLRVNGCITVRALAEAGFTRTQAEQALRYLASNGRAVRIKIGRVALWCYSMRSAVRHVGRLRRTLHALICAAGAKYVSPRDVFEIVMKNKEARRLFSRYINLRPGDTAALHFLSGLLASMYGETAFRVKKGRTPLYFAVCRRRLPPLARRQKKQYRSVQVRVEPELLEAALKAAEAEGVSISALVRRAVEKLIERYSPLHNALELKNMQKIRRHVETRKKEDKEKEEVRSTRPDHSRNP
jgi:antitoxin component of RelBE/YafQ-DinJ toxin-antitoxin module